MVIKNMVKIISWLFPFVSRGCKNGIQPKDIYSTSENKVSSNLGDLLEKNWNYEIKEASKKKKVPSLLKAFIKTFGLSYMKQGLWLVLQVFFVKTVQPYILGEYLRLFKDTTNASKLEKGLLLTLAILVTSMLSTLLYQQYFYHCQIVAMKIKVASCSLLYRKILKLSSTSLAQTTSGEIINLLSNDMQRIENAVIFFHYIYATPIQVIVMGCLMYKIVGISCLSGLIFIIIEGLPIQGFLSKIQGKFRTKVSLLTGERLAAMNDVIPGIQVIKMYAWEKPFQAVVEAIRKRELNLITKSLYIKSITVAMVVFTERFSLFLIILTYALLGNKLTGDVVFSLAQLTNIIQAAVCFFLPLSFDSYAEIKVTMKRLQEFLLLEEKLPVAPNSVTIIKDTGCIKLVDVTAGWLPTSLTLTDITLNITPGTLCCVLGKVGVGKTSFFHVLLKELPTSTGKAYVTGKVSYASQLPWLFVASVRNNILFGQQYLSNKYQNVVKACALVRDFQQFPQRDQTIVGERGVSLSGGQRARINLARAVYLDADIYLLDDPLSAVDTHVAKHLFEECIVKYLQNKTRVLVTHQMQFVKQADLIVVLEEGKVSKVMKNDEVSENSLNELNNVVPSNDESVSDVNLKYNLLKKRLSVASISSVTGYDDEVDEEEEMVSKDVTFSTYWKYFCAGNTTFALIFTFALFIVAQMSSNSADIWVTRWTDAEETKPNTTESISDIYLLPSSTRFNASAHYYETSNHADTNPESSNYYLYTYAGIMAACICLNTIRPMLFCKVCSNSSKALHNKMLGSVLQAPMRFFETNPSGRILNRFSKDIGSVDEALPIALVWDLQICLVMLGIVIMTCLVVPWMLILLALTAIAVYFTVTAFLPILLTVSKMESNNRSPLFSHISATICGLATIRSAEAEGIVRKYFDSLQDVHTSTWHMSIVIGRAFCFYSENIFNALVVLTALKFVVLNSENVQSAEIGLVVSQNFILAGAFQYGVTMAASILTTMVCVERILQYTNVAKEDDLDVDAKDNLMKKWPRTGKITFSDVTLTYVPSDPPVLQNLCLAINNGEKIGIVGRTGAGKSSLVACLFRLAPIDGVITIDNIDTALIDLEVLRSKISIIPQEPVLFSATLRYNLDPLGNFNDETLWRVLENVKLKDVVDNLDQKVSSGGSNFSAGQRQLICLARAILRNNKVLVMDEATANVDPNTDALIQQTIRENFQSCTVLTIAHRLNTIMDSDRVLVMSLGKVVEFAHPHELLQKLDGYFTEMVRETGGVAEETLRNIAKEDFEKKFYDMY